MLTSVRVSHEGLAELEELVLGEGHIFLYEIFIRILIQ